MGRLLSLAHTTNGGGTTLASYNYTYNAASRITSVNSLLDGLTNYSYDVTDQLTGADHGAPRPDETYSYDLNGNRTMSGYSTGSNNRMTSDGTYNYTYDNEGNRLTRTKIATGEVTEYEWDHRNRLTKVTEKNSSESVLKTTEQSYDVFDRWIRRRHDADGAGPAAAVDTFFSYDGTQVALQFDGNQASSLSHRYLAGPAVDQIFADEQVTALVTAGNTLWGLGDHLGTLRDIADRDESTGVTTVANHRVYNGFGSLTSESNSSVDLLFGFTGRPSDDTTGLQNNWHRWYDAALGQWLSEDPIGFRAGDANLRRYVSNASTLFGDPYGLESPGGAAIRDALRDTFVTGPGQILSGARDGLVEAGLYIRDVVAVGADAAVAAADVGQSVVTGKTRGWGLGVEEKSITGQTNKPGDPEFWGTALERAGRAGAAAGTLGLEPILVNSVEFCIDGDAEKLRRGNGAVAGGNLASAGFIRVGQGLAGRAPTPGATPKPGSTLPPNPMRAIGEGVGQAAEQAMPPPGARTPLPGTGKPPIPPEGRVAPQPTTPQPMEPLPTAPSPPGVGTKAVVPETIGQMGRPIAGKWPAIMKGGKVYVHRFHSEANKMANGGVIGPEDAYGMVELDECGNVISASW